MDRRTKAQILKSIKRSEEFWNEVISILEEGRVEVWTPIDETEGGSK